MASRHIILYRTVPQRSVPYHPIPDQTRPEHMTSPVCDIKGSGRGLRHRKVAEPLRAALQGPRGHRRRGPEHGLDGLRHEEIRDQKTAPPPNLPTKIIPAKIAWLRFSSSFPASIAFKGQFLASQEAPRERRGRRRAHDAGRPEVASSVEMNNS